MTDHILDVILAVAGRPLLTLLMFGLLVIPLEMLLARFMPDGGLKALLFDRTLFDRKPEAFVFGLLLSGGLAIAALALLFA